MINIQNEGNECFRWCLLRYLNPVRKIPGKIKNTHKEFAIQLDFKGVQFPVHKKDYAKIEKENNISISVFGHENKTSYHVSILKQTFESILICYYHQILKTFIIF